MPEFIIGARGHDFGRHTPEELLTSIGKAGFRCTQLAYTKAIEGVKSYADITPELVEATKAAVAASGGCARTAIRALGVCVGVIIICAYRAFDYFCHDFSAPYRIGLFIFLPCSYFFSIRIKVTLSCSGSMRCWIRVQICSAAS